VTVTDQSGDLPFVDEHRVTVRAPGDVAWRALTSYVAALVGHGPTPFTRLLGTDPPAGFEVAEEVPRARVVLRGRHRFSHYRLELHLDAAGPESILRARTYALFPGPHGTVYRLLVISSRAHVVATRRILATIARRAETQVW
jgi:hypothetical protein